MKNFILLPVICGLVGCTTSSLDVTSQYWSRRDLASTIIDTPDPRKNDSNFGQRLLISWSVSKKIFNEGVLELHIKIKLKNGELISEVIPLQKASGCYPFPIYGDNFTKKGGLASYFVELQSNGHTIETYQNKLWVEPITFS